MKPLQFSQEKYNNAWLSKLANVSVTGLEAELNKIQAKHSITRRSLNWKKTRLAIATLLTEYYSILFDPQYRSYFRPMYDLSLLFPTADIISISPETNFILVPLPLPTYQERTDRWRFLDNCPFLKIKPNNDTSEFVRDLDYLTDSETYKQWEHVIWSNYRHLYHHTSRAVKRTWTWKELIWEARLFVYKYQDVPTYIAKKNFRTYPKYNIWDACIPYGTFTPVFKKFTLLNIPSQVTQHSQSNQIYYKLNEYSKQKLIPWQLDERFADFFDFKQTSQQAIINYFMEQWLSMNEYSVPEIKSGIRRLKDIIKRWKPLPLVPKSPSTLPPNDPKFDDYKPKRGRPKRWDQRPDYRVRTAKLYKPDWTVVEFNDIDMEEYKQYTINQLKEKYLSSNQSDQWLTTEHLSQQ